MTEKYENIEIRSDEVQDIIGKTPSWLLRSGLTVILCFIVLLFVGSWLVHYPDIVRARIEVLSENPPADIVARTTGRIDLLFVEDGDVVSEGDLIAILENTANFDDVMSLEDNIAELGPFFNAFDTTYYRPLSSEYQLGEIQSEYSAFLRLYNNYMSFVRLNYYPQKINSLNEQVSMQRIYYDRLWSQRQILEDDYNIQLEQYRRDSILYEQEVLALADFKKSEASMLQKKSGFNQARLDLASTDREINQLEQEVVSAEKEYEDQKQKLQAELVESFNVLRSRMQYWQNTFVLEASIDGKVSFTKFWSRNQQVNTGDIVFTVVPENESEIIGRVDLPFLGAGKIKPGQQVNIRFDNFPYMEYGVVRGTVSSISLVPSNDYYIAEISLPQDLHTNYNITLPFSQQMKGDAEIITEDLRLLQRIINPVRSLLKEKVLD